jgi:hypothetical protein
MIRSGLGRGGPQRTHGLSKHPLYGCWAAMMSRCCSQANRSYHRYGGRGVTVCLEWQDRLAFIEWIEANLGPRPAGKSLDRIDNDGNYEPGNVRWATVRQQSDNQERHARINWQKLWEMAQAA